MSAGMLAAFNGVVSQNFPKSLDKNATVVPVGLDFGPTWISTCFSIISTEESEEKYWTGYPCGQVYKDFYQEALDKKVQTHLEYEESSQSAVPLVPTEERELELIQVFARHIEEARLMGVWALDKNPMLNFKVMAISVPDHWDVSARTVVAKAARLAGQPLDSSHMILDLPQAVLSAYRMREDTASRHLMVLVHYHETYLHLMLVRMSGTGSAVKGQVYLPDLGEDAILKASDVGSRVDFTEENLNEQSPGDSTSSGKPTEKPLTEASPTEDYSDKEIALENPTPEESTPEQITPGPSTSTHQAHNDTAASEDIDTEPPKYSGDLQPIQEALRKFVILIILSNTPNLPREPRLMLKYAVSDVKYIVVDGEASVKGRRALSTAIEEMFADMDWLSVEGNIHDCGAYGANIAALMQVGNPKHLDDWKDLPGYLAEEDA